MLPPRRPRSSRQPQPVIAEQRPAAAPSVAKAAPAGPTRFSFQQSVTTVRESDVAARIVIRRSGDLSGAASVSWWTVDGTALADSDYADLGARIERFEPGEASRTVYVPLTNDAVAEPAKSFGVRLGRRDGATAGRIHLGDARRRRRRRLKRLSLPLSLSERPPQRRLSSRRRQRP